MAGKPQMSLTRLTLILYPFGAGAMAVNLFFASLIASWLGWPVLTPVQSVGGGAVLGLPATCLKACRCNIAFTACFAVWTILSIFGFAIKGDLGLNDTQFALVVATSILTASLTRIFLDVWTEKNGGRVVFSEQMILAAFATWALICGHLHHVSGRGSIRVKSSSLAMSPISSPRLT
jgi:hypothetical protein